MELLTGSKEADRKIMACPPDGIATNRAPCSTSAPTPSCDEHDSQKAKEHKPQVFRNTPIFTNGIEEMRRKLNLTRNEPSMAASKAFLADVGVAAARAAEKPSHSINTASASTVLAEHDEKARQLNADWNALPAELPYQRSKRDEKKYKARIAERKKKMQNPSWKGDLKELDKMATKLKENQKQWSELHVVIKKVMAKRKPNNDEKYTDSYEKILPGPRKTDGPTKKVKRTINGWEEVVMEDDGAEAMIERKQLRKRHFSPYNTWKWDDLSSSDEADTHESRVVAEAIKILKKPADDDDKDDEPMMHSLFSDNEVIAADPPLRTKQEKAMDKAKKQERQAIEEERKAREELRPLLHPFFKSNRRWADHILHAGALPVDVLKKCQFFPVSNDVRKAKMALYKQKYQKKMALKTKKDEVERNRASKKQRRFETRRQKRSDYAHRLAVSGWDFPQDGLISYEDAVANAQIIPVLSMKTLEEAPVQPFPSLPLAPGYARDVEWTFPIWDSKMAWTEYDTLPGRFEAISKIIKDDDWNDQFVKGSKLDQDLMHTIVVPVWKAMTYDEKVTVLGGQRVDPLCFWSDDEDDVQSYVSSSPKIVDPFDIEGRDCPRWLHSCESDSESLIRSESLSASFRDGKVKPAMPVLCTDKAAFDSRKMNVSRFLKFAMSISSTERVSSDEIEAIGTETTWHVRSYLTIEKANSDKEVINEPASLKSIRSSLNTDKASFKEEGVNESGLLSSDFPISESVKAEFNADKLNELTAIMKAQDSPENSFRISMGSDISTSITEEIALSQEEIDESLSRQSSSFSSIIKRTHVDHQKTDRAPEDSLTSAAPKDTLSGTETFNSGEKMPCCEMSSNLFKEANLSDFEEPFDNPDPDLDLNILFQRIGALAVGEEAFEAPLNSTSNREAELIFNLLQKEALVRHWLPKRTFSYDNAAWKTRISIIDLENKEAVNPAIFPSVIKNWCEDIRDSDPERIDLSLPNRNNVLQDRPDMQINWISIADEYRLGLNGRQRLTKPGWAKNYDLARAQQPNPLIYLPKNTLEFEEVGYFSEVLPQPLVFPKVIDGSYDNADWIWQKHCIDQRIGLRPRDRRSASSETVNDEGFDGLIGDNLPPEDMSFDTTRSIRSKTLNGDSSFEMPVKFEKTAGVPDEVFAQMLKMLEEYRKPVPETEALGRPPPEMYIQPDGPSAAVLMKAYQEEYEDFRRECPAPTSIRFDRKVYAETTPLSPQKKAKKELDDYLALMDEHEQLEFLKDVADFLNELAVPLPEDIHEPSNIAVEPAEDSASCLGRTRRKLDIKPNLKVDDSDTKRATEDILISKLNSVFHKDHTPVASAGSHSGSSNMNEISVALFRRSERYSLRDIDREKPNSRAPLATQKTPSVSSVATSVRSKNMNIALDASKVRILQKMKDRGDSAEKQASMAAALDSIKYPESAFSEPEVLLLAHHKGRSDDEKVEIVDKIDEYKLANPPMTPARARALIDYLIDVTPAMDDDELKENIIRFFGKRLFAYSLTSLDLIPVHVSEKEAHAYLQQRFEAHRLIEDAEEANAKETKAKEIKSVELMSEREAQYSFEATMTPAKARALLDWAQRTQPHLYIKHMLCPGLLEYCETELDAASVAVTEEDCVKFIAWNMQMRKLGQNLMELYRAARLEDKKTDEDKAELRTLQLISVARGRAMIEWLFENRPDLEIMKLLQREEHVRIIGIKADPEARVTENEAITFFNLLSKRAMLMNRTHLDQEAQNGGTDENFLLFEEETKERISENISVASHTIEDSQDGSVFEDTFENDPTISPALAMQLIAWVLDVKPDCNPKYVLGDHFIRFVNQYLGPELEPLGDDEAFPLFKKYAVAQQFRLGTLKRLHEGPAHKPEEHEDPCADLLLCSSKNLGPVLGELPGIDCPLELDGTKKDPFGEPKRQDDIPVNVSSHHSESETSVLEKFPDIDIGSSAPPRKIPDTLRLRLKPSQAGEFLEYLKRIHGHDEFKDKDFDRMIKAYIQLPDQTSPKDFSFGEEALGFFKQMVKTQMISFQKRHRAFDEGRLAYAYGAGTDPDIRRERGEDVPDEVEEMYIPYDDMYDGISNLFGSVSSFSRFEDGKGSFRSSFRGSFGSSYAGSCKDEWLDFPSEVSSSVPSCSNKGLFIRKRLSRTFDPLPDNSSTDRGRLHLRCNTYHLSQHENDGNTEPSYSPLISASSEVGVGLSLPRDEQNKNGLQSPGLGRRPRANQPLRALALERSLSAPPSSENSDGDDPWTPLLKGRVSRNLTESGAIPSFARAETPPPSFPSWLSEDSCQNSSDCGTGSSSRMTFAQFQALRRNYRLEDANMSASFPPHGRNPFHEDVEAYNAGCDAEDDEISDMEAYEAWYNAKHGVTQEELDWGRRYFEEEQMINEMPGDPEMLGKVLGILAVIDAKVAEDYAEAVKEARVEEEKQAALSGGISRLVDDDPAHLLLHALDPKKAFKKILLKTIETEHLDVQEIEMLLDLISERDAQTEYEWVDENGEPLEGSDWADGSDEEDDIDQNYHVQEHQERMQLNFEQCEYEGALARVEAWRDAHEEHADPAFPQREREADEARKAQDQRMETIVKACEASKTLSTIPHMKHGRRSKAKTLRKKEKASPGKALSKKEVTPLLKDQNFQASLISKKVPGIISFQVIAEDGPLKAERRALVAETSISGGEELSNLRSFESGGHESRDTDIRAQSPTPSLHSAFDDVSKEGLPRTNNPGTPWGSKSRDIDAAAPSPTRPIWSVARGVSRMPSRKLTETMTTSTDVTTPCTPSRGTLSPSPSMASSEAALGLRPFVQRMPSGNVAVEPIPTTKSMKARLGFKSKDMNTAAPLPAPTVGSVSRDIQKKSSRKLTKKRKLGVENIRPSTPSSDLFSPTPSMAPSESASGSVTLGQRMTSFFKRKETDEGNDEEADLNMMSRIKSLKFKKGKKDTQ